MCYNTKQSRKAEDLEKRFNAKIEQPELFQTRQETSGFIFPKTEVITNKKPDIISHYQWGLIPSWAHDNTIQKHTLNARVETITEKPSFKDNIQNRCLIIANGFYEWQWLNKNGSKKQKFLLQLPNEELFTFAGIYSEWINPANNQKINSYSIITTEAKGIMTEIHNSKKRMPIVLTKEHEQDWLNGYNHNNFIPKDFYLEAINCSPQQTLF